MDIPKAPAQVPHFRNYSTENGLPSSETYAITQDDKGYIYIGTDKGIARFDGNRFYTYRKEQGLVDNTVFGFHHNKDTLWYFTYTSQLGYIYDNKLFAYKGNDKLRSIPFQNSLFLISSDKDGLLLNARYTNAFHILKNFETTGSKMDTAFDPANMNIVATRHGGYCLLSGSWYPKHTFIHDPEKGKPPVEIPNNKGGIVTSFAYRTKDGLLVNVRNDIYRIANGQCTKFISCEGNVLFIFKDKDENIWVGYHNKGLSLYRKSNNYKFPEHMLQGNSVSCIFQDREGGLWFASLENGIFYLPHQPLYSYEKIGSGISKTIRLNWADDTPIVFQSDHAVFRLCKDNSWAQVFPGKWINSIMGGGNAPLYFTSTGYWTNSKPSFKRIHEGKILDVNTHVWATSINKISSFNPHTLKRINSLTVNEVITCGLEVGEGKILVGTTRGLLACDSEKQTWIDQVVRDRISSLTLAGAYIIVCTKNQGVIIIDKHNYSVIKSYLSDNELKGALCTVAVCDHDSTLWIGTNKGVCKISHALGSRKDTLVWIDKYNGLISDEVNDVVIHKDKVWVATAKGISLIPLEGDFTYTADVPVDLKAVLVNGIAWSGAVPQFSYNQNNLTFQFSGICYTYAGAINYKYRLLHSGDESWHFTDNPSVNYNALSFGSYRFECMAIVPNQWSANRAISFSFTIDPPFWKTKWFIIISIILVIAGLAMFTHSRIRAIRLKSDLDAYRDKALRDQMSPHFIYNSLNTIQNYILDHDTKRSMSFLSKFARLMRLTFQNTGSALVTLESDLVALKLYVEMEQMRFPGRIDVTLPDLPASLKLALVPPLLIQPFVENAILHGILPKQTTGHVHVNIEKKERFLIITILDDGIGRADTKANNGTAASGTTVTITRIKQAWHNTNNHYFYIKDLYDGDQPSGTLITFHLPYKYDNSNNS
jgi:ligand-binding sensor domain-containing protein